MKLFKITHYYAVILLFSLQAVGADTWFPEGIQVKTGSTFGAKATADSKAIVDMRSTTKGLLPPRMTTAQRTAISAPSEGLVVFDTDINSLYQYTGAAWLQVATVTGTETLTNKSLTDPVVTDAARLTELGSTPSTPAAGFKKLYAKNDGKVYTVNSAGVEVEVGAGGGGGAQYNLLTNYNFEDATYSTDWTASGGTLAAATSTNILFDTKSATWDSSSASQTFSYAAITVPQGYKSNYCEASVYIQTPSGTATHLLQAYDGTNVIRSVTVISSTTAKESTTGAFPCPSSGTITLRLVSVNANEPLIAIDNAYLGITRDVSAVAQASFVGSLKMTGCTDWSASSSSFTVFSATSGCTYTATGDVLAPSTFIPGFRLQNVGPGRYLIFARGAFGKSVSTTNGDAIFRFNDGTNAFSEQVAIGAGSAGGQYVNSGHLSGAITYTTAQGTLTYQLQGKTSTTGSSTLITVSDDGTPNLGGQIDGLHFDVYYFPIASQTVVSSRQQRMPTVQKFTSGSGTYTTPDGVTYIEVKLVGAGGGGSSSGSAATNNGIAGGNTTFGSSLLTANGGTGGGISSSNSTGGTASVAAPAIGSGWDGANGQGPQYNNLADGTHGGNGGSSLFGGGGAGGPYGAAGSAAKTNTGSGGGGGGGAAGTAGVYAGGGGAAGAGVIAKITAPAATYAYAVGAGGAGGGAGTNGFAGGAGAAGYIEVTEFYGYTTALIANSVSTENKAGDSIARSVFTNNGSACANVSSSGVATPTRPGTGACSWNFSTAFSASPSCNCTTGVASGGNFGLCIVTSITASAVSILTSSATSINAAADVNGQITCVGPR